MENDKVTNKYIKALTKTDFKLFIKNITKGILKAIIVAVIFLLP